MYHVNVIIIAIYFVIFSAALFSLNYGSYKLHGILLAISGYVVIPFLLLNIIQAVFFVVKKIPFAVFSLLSFSLFTLFTILYSINQKELISTNIIAQYGNYWAIFSETAIATALLAWQYKYINNKAIALQKENIKIQQEIFKETAAWQEKEMQRISSLLHDTVGANLGFLRLEADNMPLTEEGRNKMAEHITRIGNEVRSMSHSFSPIILQDKGLYNAIDDMVKLIKNNSLINIQFEWLGNTQNISLQYQIIVYRIIQELMQNILKHARANNAFLQIIVQKELLSIYVEDDGIGITKIENFKGVGLKSIENLVTLLHGCIRLDSKEHEGFSISIEFNHIEDEKI